MFRKIWFLEDAYVFIGEEMGVGWMVSGDGVVMMGGLNERGIGDEARGYGWEEVEGLELEERGGHIGERSLLHCIRWNRWGSLRKSLQRGAQICCPHWSTYH